MKSPIGYLPHEGALDVEGLGLSSETMKRLFHVDRAEWLREAAEIEQYFLSFGARLPDELWAQLNQLKARLGAAG